MQVHHPYSDSDFFLSTKPNLKVIGSLLNVIILRSKKNSLENLHTYLNINLFYVPGDIWGMQTHEIFPMCNVKFPASN